MRSSRADARGARDAHAAYDRYYKNLVAQMHAMCGDRSDAEDAVQEAFARALMKPDDFAALDNQAAWLRTVALNYLRGKWRHGKHHRSVMHLLAEDASPAPPVSPHYVAVVQALQEIPYAQREAVVMHHVGDMPVDQIAEALGVPAGTVKARLSRGRAALARLLDDRETEHA